MWLDPQTYGLDDPKAVQFLRYLGQILPFVNAQGDGNSWVKDGRRYGFNSWETEGMGDGTWTDAQLATIKRIIAFKHDHYGTPLRVCPGPFSTGFGYHCLFSQWNHNNHSCPGPERVKQFNDVIVPWMHHGGTEEDDMQLTDKLWPKRKDSKEVGDVLRSLDKFIDRQDARQKEALSRLDPDALADAVAARLVPKVAGASGGLTADDVKTAVRDVLREGVDA